MSAPVQQWPAEFAERYRAAGYWTGETMGDFLRIAATRFAGRTAIVAGETRLTYAAIDATADRVAGGLLAAGLRPGDRIVVQLPNLPEFVPAIFGCFRAGIIPVFALPAHRRSEISHLVQGSGATASLIADEFEGHDYRTMMREVQHECPALRHVFVVGDPGVFTAFASLDVEGNTVLPDIDPAQVAFMQLSGGSTGVAKLIPRTHDDYLYSVRASAAICDLTPDTICLIVLPMAHNFPMSSPGFLGLLFAGGSVVLSLSPGPEAVFPVIARERVTTVALVPPLALVWLQAAEETSHDLSSLRLIQVGGARLLPDVARRLLARFGPVLQQVFGMAEGLVNYTRTGDSADLLVQTQGRPISPDDEILIVDDEDHPVADGTPGHLLTRGPYTIRAYHHAPDANSRAFTPDGFYRTGDIVRRRPDGYLEVQGRSTDQINRGGEKISPEEVENHLLAHPGVHDAAVVSLPDPWLGERSVAMVIPRADAPSAGTLKAWIRGRGVAGYKVPDRILFVDRFPATGVGKVSRKALRAAIRGALTPVPAGES